MATICRRFRCSSSCSVTEPEALSHPDPPPPPPPPREDTEQPEDANDGDAEDTKRDNGSDAGGGRDTGRGSEINQEAITAAVLDAFSNPVVIRRLLAAFQPSGSMGSSSSASASDGKYLSFNMFRHGPFIMIISLSPGVI